MLTSPKCFCISLLRIQFLITHVLPFTLFKDTRKYDKYSIYVFGYFAVIEMIGMPQSK